MDWPSLIQPKRSHRWPSRAGPPQLRLASKAAVSSLSRRAITTRSAPIRAIEAAGSTYDLLSVAGALEIPAGLAIALDAAKAAGRPYDGAVALGCVVRGETFHFEIVAGESARALMDMSVERLLALGNGILTTETIEQAEERADPEGGDKGGDAARAAIGLAHLARRLVNR
jgi:6,7-dimethyl-8-ribityllumazine synthase